MKFRRKLAFNLRSSGEQQAKAARGRGRMSIAERTVDVMQPVPKRAHLARLVLAEGTSVAGDWVLITAASIAVFRKTDSTVAVSLLLALVALPTILLGPIA